MRLNKATHGQIKRENRQLLLRAVFAGLANSRADLANETGLAKPTVSDLVGELISEGFLLERGLGQSTDEGGKRPRLLHFVPDARQVIGVSVTAVQVVGVLANLDGEVIVEHKRALNGAQGNEIVSAISQAVNGLRAQLTAPLMCIGVGVDGEVDLFGGTVRSAEHMGWQDVPLHLLLRAEFDVPVHVANSTELAAMAHFAFGEAHGATSVATISVDSSVGVGLALNGAAYHHGALVGSMLVGEQRLAEALNWDRIAARAADFFPQYTAPGLPSDALTYLHIRQAAHEGNPTAQAIIQDIGTLLGHVVAWVAMLLRPQHVVITGQLADLGEVLLRSTLATAAEIAQASALAPIRFALDNTPNLAALGAVAQAIQEELGLVA